MNLDHSLDDLFDFCGEETNSVSESSIDGVPRVSVRRPPLKNPKKRKSTYHRRRDEIKLLQEHVKHLQEELKMQRAAGGSTMSNSMGTDHAASVHIERNNLRLAGTQSLVSAYSVSRSDTSIPLSSCIHLPVDPAARADLLSSMRDPKLDSALRFMTERTRFLDLRTRHRQRESFTLPCGDTVSTGLGVVQFDGGHSLQQVFDEFIALIGRLDLIFSDKLGILTIQEGEDLGLGHYHQQRLRSSLPEGVAIESNLVMYGRCVPATETTPGYAIGTSNHVTQDDLYPYHSGACGRLDVSGSVMLTEVPTSKGTAVALAIWSYARFRGPNYSVPTECEKNISRLLEWCSLVPKDMKERLSLVQPAAQA